MKAKTEDKILFEKMKNIVENSKKTKDIVSSMRSDEVADMLLVAKNITEQNAPVLALVLREKAKSIARLTVILNTLPIEYPTCIS